MYTISNPPQHYRAGTTARIWIALISAGSFYTPPTPPLVTIFYPDETGAAVLVDGESATAYLAPPGIDQSANYYYDFQIPSNAPAGDYPGYIDMTDSLGNAVGTPRSPIVHVDPHP